MDQQGTHSEEQEELKASEQEERESKANGDVNVEEESLPNGASGGAQAKEDEDFKTKFYYLAAELENQKKRHQRETENLIKFGNERLLKDLIEVMDNFDRTVEAIKADKSMDEKSKNIVVGIEMVRSQFLDVLGKYGVVIVESIGKKFDPNFHEALAEQEVEGKEAGDVVAEYQKGYLLNGRLLRASKVVVAKAKS